MTKVADPLRVTPAQISRAMRWPLGTPVTVTRDNGVSLETVTRSHPWLLNSTWVILVEGLAREQRLARIEERTP